MRKVNTSIGWSLAVALVLSAAPAGAPVAAQTVAPTPTTVTQIATGRGKLINLPRPISDVFVANDSIADVQVRSPTQIYIFAKGPGETTVYATAKGGGVVFSTTVRVGNNIETVGQMLKLAMPDAQITATPMNGMVLLTGTVANPDDANEAERLTQAFVGEQVKVLTRLKTATPLQVNLQVKFAEVSRNFIKNIGVNLQNRPRGSFLFGFSQGRQGVINTAPGDPTPGNPIVDGNGLRQGQTLNQFPQAIAGGTLLGLAGKAFGADLLGSLDLAERNGQVSTLAEPNLTALSGETGTFLAGGEIPIPVSQGLGAVSVEYRQYGISLAYTPTVLGDGRISLRVRPEVSQLTSVGAVQINGTTIPALSTRRAETTVELGSGQSFMIAGLLQNNHNNSIDQAPGLGDIPILGALFRSNGFQRNETELLIVITPYLVKPVNAGDIILPTDGYKAPTDLGRVFMGELNRGKTGGSRAKPSVAKPETAQPSIGVTAPEPMAPGAPEPAAPGPQPAPQRDDRKAVAPVPPRKMPSATPGFSLQ
ncbi:type II and III secretion system protein family protein [Sphingomonas sp.]|uniref:type II and III secretion system protein family protein n=1 Tax=Sphingomonas sp. TaxID=28214 RepID=UPI001D6A2BCC|nr:type II and III secretion system protein family protein [Sphingomonas sp.]MBX9797591.1 type II and III secretion system protein family protein [Sphingomonas sp.]